MSKTRSKLVIDTDCGIDDAMAIMLALSAKDVCDVVGITCCFGNCTLDNACKNVMRVLTLCGETNIPIYRGCRSAFINNDKLGTVHGSDGLGNRGHEFSTGGLTESEIPATFALIKMAKEHPKEITLVAIGPLTNLAMAHRIDPHFTENLKSIVILGGNYKGIGNATDTAEFNFYCDPESANIILTEAACSVVLVPWETVLEHGMEWEDYTNWVNTETNKGKFLKIVSEQLACEEKIQGSRQFYDCDFLAAAAVLYPDCILASIKTPASVESYGSLTKGLTVIHRKPSSDDKKCIDIIIRFDDVLLRKLREKILQ
ncbi:uncharacterized protein LOC129229688 [Uloborus diversus]|uniref:uncharacterized protein LOC129229688 n=1 Tax=Uloborus diversus TaxID=327109 RepID=UPI00240A011F|nr:uncharacterized protein LOC129229688 [Uloborus diversus]XP_054720025.1 uncharacterized protein LOC129229688 [Uloborus diversus]